MKEARSVIVLTVITAVAAAVLYFVSDWTAERRDQADRDYKLASLREVLPTHDNSPDEEAKEYTFGNGKKAVLYPARMGGTLVGIAVELSTPPGYGGAIQMLVGVDTDQRVYGIKMLPGHKETPGLGTKVEDDAFKDQFVGLTLNADGKSWQVRKDDPAGVVDAVTGATITSRAVTAGVSGALTVLSEHRDVFR